MAKTAIGWTEETWNPVTGCSKVSPGCAHCYAEAMTLRFATTWGVPRLPWTPANAEQNVILHPERLEQPLRWRASRLIFVNSMSDLFHEQVPLYFIAQVFAVMALASQHTFQILTKRPERMRLTMRAPVFRAGVEHWMRHYRPGCHGVAWPLQNVWLGTSIENRRFVDRARVLGETPAAVRFISAEPLLGPLICEAKTVHSDGSRSWEWEDNYGGPDLAFYNADGELAFDWLIAGGESGAKRRPMEAAWVRDLRDVCVHEGVAFFFKQWGGWTPKAGGRELDGRTWDELPEFTAVSEYVARIRAGEVAPLVGEGADGCLASAGVVLDELATMTFADPRRPEIEAQEQAWRDAADRLASEQEGA